MKQVIDVFKRKDIERRIRILKIEIDYELVTLHDALQEKNDEKIKKSKENLEKYRLELQRLEKK